MLYLRSGSVNGVRKPFYLTVAKLLLLFVVLVFVSNFLLIGAGSAKGSQQIDIVFVYFVDLLA